MSLLETALHSTGRIDIPTDIAAVDAAWLTRALSVGRPGLVVHSAEVLKSLGGACTKLRVALKTNDATFPPTVIVKGCFEPHSAAMVKSQLREANAYTRIVPRLKDVNTVACFFVQGDETRGSALILEDLDLRGVSCLRTQEPIASFRTAAAFLDAIARLHAHWWNAPELGDDGEFGWLPGPNDAMLTRSDLILSDPKVAADYLSRPRATGVSRILHDPGRLRAAFHAMRANTHHLPVVLSHGDTHLANLYLTADRDAGFLDWTSLRTPWAHDVAYFISGGLHVQDRRRWERTLLRHYLSRLRAYGVSAPSYEEAWLAYRQWIAWGVVVWLVNSNDYHSEANISAMSERYCSAFVDHGAFELLGV